MDEATNQEKRSEVKCRWSSYGSYRLLLWAWMMNEISVMFSPGEISQDGFYAHGSIQALVVIFASIPVVYSEICIAQYTNCNIITMWDFFPLFRCVGFGTLFLILLKTIYMLVLASWYLEYSFFAALDPPPWMSCEEFNDSKCMVKIINVSIFQHCLEAELQFDDDCGVKTASKCFYNREIGENNTKNSVTCLYPWKTLVASSTISVVLFFLSIRKEKFIQAFVKLLVAYVCIVILVLFCVALSKSGTWYATMATFTDKLTIRDVFHSMNRGFLSLGSGAGIIIYLSRDIPFRSPATMTAISISLFSLTLSMLYALIAFSGIKTMIYFHGEEQNVIEIGEGVFFVVFAGMTELLNYFDSVQLWSFIWYSSILFCLFVNLWILYLFFGELLYEIELARKYKNLGNVLLLFILNVLSWPFFCSDLTAVLTDATEIMQITNSLLFSLSLYWFYGFKNHNVDIIFMIGIKASYFWKICWLLNPIFIAIILYSKWDYLEITQYDNSYYIESIDLRSDLLLLYILLSIYHFILFAGLLLQVFFYYRQGEIRELCSPTVDWGPRDQILYKSRKMFMPEIMTTEFLYRQVRLRGYGQKKHNIKKPGREMYDESGVVEWSALTSN